MKKRFFQPAHLTLLFTLASLILLTPGCGREGETNQAVNPETPSTIELFWVQGPQGNLAVEDGGKGGVPVLFLHGLAGEIAVWDSQLHYLRENRRALAMDLRDHGLSDPPADGEYSLDAFSSDVEAVVNALELEHFVLAGHSMSGAVIARYAGLHPECVAGLIFVDPVGDPSSVSPGKLDQFLAEVREGNSLENIEEFFQTLLEHAHPATREEVLATTGSLEPEAYFKIWEALFAYSPVDDLQKYPGPMLTFITSDNQEPYSLQNLVEGMETHLMSDVSHWLMMEKPDEFNARMESFLEEIEEASGSVQQQ